jgi:hypothetical protein
MNVFKQTLVSMSVALLVSCSAREVEKGEIRGAGYESLAMQKYGQGVEFVQNMSGTTMLCVKKSKPTQLTPQHQIAFFVYDMKARNVLFEDSIPNGSVNWNDDFSIVVSIVPGTVRDDDKTPAPRPGYIYDVRTRKTRDLESVNVR